jgi:hypothetical protein
MRLLKKISHRIEGPLLLPNRNKSTTTESARVARRNGNYYVSLEKIFWWCTADKQYVDVTPKFIDLATTNKGNHPFHYIVKKQGDRDEIAVLNIEDWRKF